MRTRLLHPALPLLRSCCLVAFITLSACTPNLPHTPVPEASVEQATVKGFPPNIRFWADEAPADIQHMIHERIAKYRNHHAAYYREHGSYPPLNYLAISGGAYDGAFGAGLLYGWSASGTRPRFTLVTGISTGALIAPFVFVGPKYDETIKALFTETNSDNIFNTNLWQIVRGLTGGVAVTDNTPLAKRIETYVTHEVLDEIAEEYRRGRVLFIGTTNIEAQRGVIWDIGAIAASGNSGSLKLIHQIMLASAAVPGLFAPEFIDVEVNGHHYSEIHADGGVTSQVFVYPLKLNRSVIEEFTKYRIPRNLYIVRNSKIDPEYKPLEPGVFALTQRSLETLIKYQGLGDLYRIYLGSQRDKLNYHLATIPHSFSAESHQLFDPAYMTALFNTGYELGHSQNVWMKAPPGIQYTVTPEQQP